MSFVSVLMLIFCILGAVDRMIGNRFGLGKEFEKGFMLLGNMALSMIGMITVAPLIASLLSPCFDWIYRTLGIDPSIIPASLFANDMGGASLSVEIGKSEAVGKFSALVVSAMMGCTISFTIPYALGIVDKKIHREVFFGFLCGIMTIPVGCILSGLLLGISLWQLIVTLLPLMIFSAIIACGLIFAPDFTVKAFAAFGAFIKCVVTVGLVLGIIKFLTGIELVKGLADIQEGADICFNAAVVLSGAFPMMYIVSKILSKPLEKLGRLLKVNSASAMGFISTVVTNATTFEMMKDMDSKGILLNAAFAVSAAFVFGSHLAFTMAFDADYITAMIVGKLVSGLFAVALGLVLYKRIVRPETGVKA